MNWVGLPRGWEWPDGWQIEQLPTHWAEISIPTPTPTIATVDDVLAWVERKKR